MVCFNFYVFTREGTCIFYHEWHRPKSVKLGAGSVADDRKQMCGLLYSLRTLTAALDPAGCEHVADACVVILCGWSVGAGWLALCVRSYRCVSPRAELEGRRTS